MMASPRLLAGRKIAVLGSASGLGLAVAAACDESGAEVFGIDTAPVFSHLSAFYRFDPADPLAADAVAAALPDGLDGLALCPAGGLAQALTLPKRLATLLAPRMARPGAILARTAPVTGDWAASLALIRAAAALRPGDEDRFAAQWSLDREPALAQRAIGWGMLAFVLSHHARWPGVRVNALTTCAADGRLPLHHAADPAEGPRLAAQAAVFLLSPLSAGLSGANLAADGGMSAQIQTSLEGL